MSNAKPVSATQSDRRPADWVERVERAGLRVAVRLVRDVRLMEGDDRQNADVSPVLLYAKAWIGEPGQHAKHAAKILYGDLGHYRACEDQMIYRITELWEMLSEAFVNRETAKNGT